MRIEEHGSLATERPGGNVAAVGRPGGRKQSRRPGNCLQFPGLPIQNMNRHLPGIRFEKRRIAEHQCVTVGPPGWTERAAFSRKRLRRPTTGWDNIDLTVPSRSDPNKCNPPAI